VGSCGTSRGYQDWRIEKFQVIEWPEHDYGKFFNGDSYILLKTYKVNDALKWDVHFWLGEFTTQDEAGTAAYKTVELDDFLGGYPVEYREVQGYESDRFQSYFSKGIQILVGGVDTGFKHVEESTHRTRLLHIKGRGKNVAAIEVPLSSASLNSGDAFILDEGLNCYLFMGAKAGIGEKTKANQITRGLDDERGGKVQIHVIGEFEMHKEDETTNKFWSLLGGRVASIKSADAGGSDDKPIAVRNMLRLSDATGSLVTTPVTFAKSSLHSSDVFIVDVGSEVFVWVGNATTERERKYAIQFGQKYLSQSGKPAWTPLSRVVEGAENESMLSHF